MDKNGYIAIELDSLFLESRIRNCISVDKDGEVNHLKINKYALIHHLGIHARDLRKLEPALSVSSTIIGKELSVLVNLDFIRAVITTERILFMHVEGDDVENVIRELKSHLREEENLPFEFLALKVVVKGICSYFDGRTKKQEISTHLKLGELRSKIQMHNPDCVHELKSEVLRIKERMQGVQDALRAILDDDDEMAAVCLTRKINLSPISGSQKNKPNVKDFEKEIQELDTWLEAYLKRTHCTLQKLTTLHGHITKTEYYINTQIESRKYKMLQTDLTIGSGTFCQGLFSMVTGVFGMNIPFKWNNHGSMFKWVVVYSAVVSVTILGVILRYAFPRQPQPQPQPQDVHHQE